MDPSGDATELRLTLARLGASLRRDPRHARPLGPPARRRRPRGGNGGAGLHGRGRALPAGDAPGGFTPPGVSVRPYTPDVLLVGGETDRPSRGSTSRCSSFPGTRRRTSRTTPTGASSPATSCSRARSGRTDFPGCRLGHAPGLDPRARGLAAARDGRLSRPWLDDDARRRARAQPISRRPPSGARRMSDTTKIERPRGTHDVLPAEQPQWQRVTGELERLCSLYGYRPIQTPVFEDTALFERTSGQGSDVVQKEMYTFSDRSDRSLTLRPEGTAPICRAYVEHGFHRDPQPAKLFTIATDVSLRRARPRAVPRALAGLGGGDRKRRSCDRRRADPALRHAPPPRRRDPLPARGELDRLSRVPSRVPGGAPLLAGRERGAARRGDAGEGLGEPAPRLRQLRGQAGERACCARRSAEDR